MEALRLTMNSARLETIIDLPAAFYGREVDVIVLPKSQESNDQPHNSKRGSTMGCFQEYANPALRELEEGAWERAAVEKYLEKMREDHS